MQYVGIIEKRLPAMRNYLQSGKQLPQIQYHPLLAETAQQYAEQALAQDFTGHRSKD